MDFRRPRSLSDHAKRHHPLLYLSPSAATYPLCRPAGEGWGEGGSTNYTTLIFPKQKSHPHPSLPPPDGGRDRVADAVRGLLKITVYEISDDLV